MNDTTKKLNEEARAEIVTAFAAKAVEDLIAKTKTASDDESGSFKVIVSTSDTDRQGEIVDQNGWDLSFFKMNPIVLWAHDYSSLPIGMCTSISVQNGKLIAEGKFAPEDANPFAQQVRRLYDGGYVSATSVGFIPKQYDADSDAKITKAELLEFSFVPVPANPHALTMNQMKKLNIDRALLKTKGIEFKDAEAGSRCQQDDGTPGILGVDPSDSDGALICLPDDKAIEVSKTEAAGELSKAIEIEHSMHADNHLKALDVFRKAMKEIDISKSAEQKSIDLEAMDCYKEYAKGMGLENQRHSKCVTDAIDVFMKDLGAGYDLSEPMEKMKQSIVDEIKTALKDIAASEGGKKNAANRSKTSHEIDMAKGLQEFLANKDLVKDINIITGKVLRQYNLQEKA